MTTKEDKLRELESASIGSLLLKYSWPAVIGMTAMSLYNLIDAYYIGLWCGPASIAGLALIFPIMNLMVAVGMLIGLGSAANVSLALGRGDREEAFRVLGHTMQMGAPFAAAVGIVIYIFLPEVLVFFGAQGETYQPAYDFMRVTALVFPITAAYMNLNHVMRASGYPKMAMYSLLLSVGVNIAVAPVFIYVLDMGMSGAALATVTGQVIGFVFVLRHFLKSDSVLHFRRGMWSFSMRIARRICMVGLPPCTMTICGCLVVLYFNRLFLAYEGDMGVGAFGIVNRLTFFFAMVVMGIAQGMQPIVGYNYGVGAMKRVRATLFRGMLAATAVMSVGYVLMMSFPHEIMGLFVKESAENAVTQAEGEKLIRLGVEGISIFMIFLPIIGPQIIVGNFFQAIGKPVVSIFLNLMRQMIILIPLLSILPHYYGVRGIWASGAVSDAISALVCATVLLLYLRKRTKPSSITPSPELS